MRKYIRSKIRYIFGVMVGRDIELEFETHVTLYRSRRGSHVRTERDSQEN